MQKRELPPDSAKEPESNVFSVDSFLSSSGVDRKGLSIASESLSKEPARLSLADLQKAVWGVEYVMKPWKPWKLA